VDDFKRVLAEPSAMMTLADNGAGASRVWRLKKNKSDPFINCKYKIIIENFSPLASGRDRTYGMMLFLENKGQELF